MRKSHLSPARCNFGPSLPSSLSVCWYDSRESLSMSVSSVLFFVEGVSTVDMRISSLSFHGQAQYMFIRGACARARSESAQDDGKLRGSATTTGRVLSRNRLREQLNFFAMLNLLRRVEPSLLQEDLGA